MKSNEIYKITNKVTGKIYIGMTCQGSGARYRHHWYESRIGEPSPIHRSMAKYGEESFTLEVLDFADTYEELKEKEKHYIKLYNAMDRTIGYNISEGGDGCGGRKCSEETKEKLRQIALQRPPASEETRQKISEANKGKKMTLLTYQKAMERNAKKAKAILQFDKEMNFIAEYTSISAAAKATGIDRTTIQKQLNGTTILGNRNKNLIKYFWKLKEQSIAA